jgi:hypothetical protein
VELSTASNHSRESENQRATAAVEQEYEQSEREILERMVAE